LIFLPAADDRFARLTSKSRQRDNASLKDAVEHELTFYPHLEIVAILLKVETSGEVALTPQTRRGRSP